jgi:hypothetical protein
LSTHGEGQDPPAASGLPAADDPARGGADLRGAPRFALLMRVAKLVVGGRERFCVIRDASTSGLKIRLFTPLPATDALPATGAMPEPLLIELANGDRHAVECMWNANDHAGLRFVEPIALDRLLDEARAAGRRRHVRLRIALDGMLTSGKETVPATFADISQQGAAIDCEKWLMINELVKIETERLPAIFAKVRWRQHPRYGLIFEQTFVLEELDRLCADLPAPTPGHTRDTQTG